VKLNDQFFLTEEQDVENDQLVVWDDESEENNSEGFESDSTKNIYFVQETEICDGNLADYLAHLRKNSIILKDKVKHILVV